MKKTGDNSFGIASVVLGIVSILTSANNGLIFGIVALVFAVKQKKIEANSWSRAGKILSIIGIALSILLMIALVVGFLTVPQLFTIPQ